MPSAWWAPALAWSGAAAARRPSTSPRCARRPARPDARPTTVKVSPAAAGVSPGLHVARPPTLLGRKLAAREFVVTVELDPPRGHTVEKLVQGAKLLRERGVDIVDINDGSLGRVRMAVLPTALLVREATGLDINMH